MKNGFLIQLAHITFVIIGIFSALMLHRRVQSWWGMITPAQLKVLDL